MAGFLWRYKNLRIDESFFSVLQTHYDLVQQKKKKARNERPNLKRLRSALFWDTDIGSISWEKSKTSVIERTFERGNDQEILEIIRFYGNKEVQDILNQIINRSAALESNMEKYFH